jgi:hypothetical protein
LTIKLTPRRSHSMFCRLMRTNLQFAKIILKTLN